ncbi:MAG: DUF3298 and DUF4163 domain-containing protein [Caloramator sp.]|nr:DUF3298 and DUF4163 domain-containing protein [Caloramator sp.]
MSNKKLFIPIILIISIFTLIAGCDYVTTAKSKTTVKINSKNVKYNNDLVEIDLNIPILSEVTDQNIENKINSTLEKDIINFKDEIEKIAKEDYDYCKKNKDIPYHKHSAVVNFDVKYNKNGILSIPISFYSYTGGAHGNTDLVAYNYNLVNGNEIKLKDIFKENFDYKSFLINEIIKKIKEDKDMMYFDDAVETIKKMDDNQRFYLANDGIVIYYGLYEIAPYAAGIQEFKIPYEILKDHLNIEL